MAAKQGHISAETVLLAGGVIILWPILKSILNILKAASDILSIPADLVDKIGKSAQKEVHDAGYSLIFNYVMFHQYTGTAEDQKNMTHLLSDDFHLTPGEKATLIQLWKINTPLKILYKQSGFTDPEYEKTKSDLIYFLRQYLP